VAIKYHRGHKSVKIQWRPAPLGWARRAVVIWEPG